MISATTTGVSHGLAGNKLLPLTLLLSSGSHGPSLSPQMIGPSYTPDWPKTCDVLSWLRDRDCTNLRPPFLEARNIARPGAALLDCV